METVLDVYERQYRQPPPVVAIDESAPHLISAARSGFTDSKRVRSL